MRDWLLIYEDTFVELSVKDAYDELEIIVVLIPIIHLLL